LVALKQPKRTQTQERVPQLSFGQFLTQPFDQLRRAVNHLNLRRRIQFAPFYCIYSIGRSACQTAFLTFISKTSTFGFSEKIAATFSLAIFSASFLSSAGKVSKVKHC
jgi:hypothetical protein